MLPNDLVQLGFKLIERNERVLLISSKAGVVVGANLTEAVKEARKLQGYLAWLARKQAEETNA